MQAANTYKTYLQHETMRVVMPYIVIGALALCWAVLIAMTKFPKLENGDGIEPENHGSFRELFQHPNFLLAILAQFMYVGAQVGTWSYFIQYVQDSTHQPEKVAGYFLTGTLAAFGAGRFISAALMMRIRPNLLMGIYSLANVLLVGLGILFPGWIGLWAIFITSFFMSVMYPTIFALGIDGLGRNTKIGGSLLVMAIVGGAVLTPVMGWIAQTSHRISLAYGVPMTCYCVIAFYSFVGQRLSRRGIEVKLAVVQ
jgi:FHS family L-fucose permease-like MFS transporter